MPIDDDTMNALRDARADAKKAEMANDMDSIREYGGRARKTLGTIERSGMENAVRETIEEAIRHVINAQRAVNLGGGRHDARMAREQISNS